MVKAFTAKDDAFCPSLQGGVNLVYAVTMYGKHSLMLRLVRLRHQLLIVFVDSNTRRGKCLQTSPIQSLAGHTSCFVHFAHGHHHVFIMLKAQTVQKIFRCSQPVQLLTHAGFIQGTLTCCFYNKISLAIATVAGIVCKQNRHRLADFGSHHCVHGNTLFGLRAEKLLRIVHQVTVQCTENAVVQAYAIRHVNRHLLAYARTLHTAACKLHIRNRGAYASAHAHPKFQTVTQVQLLIQLNDSLITLLV